MQIARDQLDDVGEPVLSDWSNHINGYFILDILTVASVGDFSGFDSSRIGVLRIDESFVFLLFVGWFNPCGLG